MRYSTFRFDGRFLVTFSERFELLLQTTRRQDLAAWALVILYGGYEPLIRSGLFGPWSLSAADYFRVHLPRSMGGDRTEVSGQRTLRKVYRDMRQTFGSGFMTKVRAEIAQHV
ncbi:hypothetical protein SAMN05421753_113169 [Planctomicrobium piriforme]|uniref:Uncharacterized protein n=1 Tax=Planctomicrobium piriforme TaxID=1576369 RepID=A0A1I3M627_9PLAN|nr:hypothetical protein SAMN05421753_113169 [Planctomicrobium piriforme]